MLAAVKDAKLAANIRQTFGKHSANILLVLNSDGRDLILHGFALNCRRLLPAPTSRIAVESGDLQAFGLFYCRSCSMRL